jgi:cobalt/nickel transport system permease protein
MGIIGSLGGYGIFSLIYALLRKSRKGFFIALAVSSWLSIVMGASAAAIELAVSGTSPSKVALPAMAGIHALIGIGEAIITTTAISLILKTRPDLVVCFAKKGAFHEKTA